MRIYTCFCEQYCPPGGRIVSRSRYQRHLHAQRELDRLRRSSSPFRASLSSAIHDKNSETPELIIESYSESATTEVRLEENDYDTFFNEQNDDVDDNNIRLTPPQRPAPIPFDTARISKADEINLTEAALANKFGLSHKFRNAHSAALNKKQSQIFYKSAKSQDTLLAHWGSEAGLKVQKYDCCENSCYMYAHDETLENCPVCSSARWKKMPIQSSDREKTPVQEFTYIPILPRLAKCYERLETATKFRYRHNAELQSNENARVLTAHLREPLTEANIQKNRVITDVYDGQHYQSLKAKGYFSDCRDIALSFSSDGAYVVKQSTGSAWFLMLVNYNLDPNIRYLDENLIMCGIIPGPRNPGEYFLSFLEPLIKELESINQSTIAEYHENLTAYDIIDAEWFHMRVHLIHVLGDMPASAKCSGLMGHNARRACRDCMIDGIPGPKSGICFPHLPPLDDDWQDQRHIEDRQFSYDHHDLPLRSHELHLSHLLELEKLQLHNSRLVPAAQKQFGVKTRSIFLRLPTISMPTSFCIDSMHLLWINNAANMLKLFRKSMKDENVWNEIESNLKVELSGLPSSFGTGPGGRGTSPPEWTAEELQSWTLFYSLPSLKGKINDVNLKHWALFVEAATMCQQRMFTSANIDRIEKLLRDYVAEFEILYVGRIFKNMKRCLIVVHSLLHLANCIRMNGPPCSYSQYTMERMLGTLKMRVKSKGHKSHANLIRNTIKREYTNAITNVLGIDLGLSRNEVMHEEACVVPDEDGEGMMRVYGRQKTQPLAEFGTQERAELIVLYENANINLFAERFPEGIIGWQNFQCRSGDKVTTTEFRSEREIQARKRGVGHQREWVKVKNNSSSHTGSVVALLLRIRAIPHDDTLKEFDYWARLKFIKPDLTPEIVPALMFKGQFWEKTIAGRTKSNWCVEKWVKLQEIINLVGIYRIERQIFIIDRSLLDGLVTDEEIQKMVARTEVDEEYGLNLSSES